MAAKTVAKNATKKTPAKSTSKIPGLYKEKHPECHKITGKFTFLYILFAVTMLVFASVTVWLFFFSTELLNKYNSIDACSRTAGCRVVTDIDYSGEE